MIQRRLVARHVGWLLGFPIIQKGWVMKAQLRTLDGKDLTAEVPDERAWAEYVVCQVDGRAEVFRRLGGAASTDGGRYQQVPGRTVRGEMVEDGA